MKKMISLNIITLFVMTMLLYCVYYLLLKDNGLKTSIASIIAKTHHLELKAHLLVLGLLPIYIAAIVFGTGLFGMYLGNVLQDIVKRHLSKRLIKARA